MYELLYSDLFESLLFVAMCELLMHSGYWGTPKAAIPALEQTVQGNIAIAALFIESSDMSRGSVHCSLVFNASS